MRFVLVTAGCLVIGAVAMVFLTPGDPARTSRPANTEPEPPGDVAERKPPTPAHLVARDTKGRSPGRTIAFRFSVEESALLVGDARLRGTAVDQHDRPVVGALVTCVPSNCRPAGPEFAERWTTKSASDGSFSFSRLPRAARYRVDAASRTGLVGSVQVEADDSESAVVVCKAMSYERYIFVTSDGALVDVDRLGFGIEDPGSLLLSRMPRGPLLDLVLRELGIELETLRERGTCWTLYPGPPFSSRRKTIRVPGHVALSVTREIRSLEQWPRATRVVLEPDETSVLYEVEFPTIDRPTGMPEEVGLLLWARPESESTILAVLNKRVNQFYAPRATRVRLEQPGVGPLQFDIIEVDSDRRLLRPRYPKYAFLRLYCSDPGLGRSAMYSIRDAWPPVRVFQFHPRFVVFGPLPVGEYSVLVTNAQPASDSSIGPLVLQEGLNAWAWKN